MKIYCLVLFLITMLAACGGGSDNAINIGSGIISPYKMLNWGDRADQVLVVTGGGESFGQSMLHLVDLDTWTDQREPLKVCSNASDMIWSESNILISCRSSQELVRVDSVNWQVTGRIDLDYGPISVVVADDGHALVSGFTRPYLSRIDTTTTDLTLKNEVRLDGFSLCMTYDSNLAYVVMPNIGVAEINPITLEVNRLYPLDAELSFACSVWQGRLLITDRDGYLHAFNLTNGTLETVDLALALGIDRADLAIRGIDPIDILILDDTHLLVINNRKDSLLFRVDSVTPFRLSVITQLPSGAYAKWLPDNADGDGTVLITRPTANLIYRSSPTTGIDSSDWISQRNIVGTHIVDTALLNDGGSRILFALDSDGSLTLINTDSMMTYLVTNQDGKWVLPLGNGSTDSMLVTAVTRKGERDIVALNAQGHITNRYSILTDWPLFSIRSDSTRAVITARMQGAIQIIDLASQTSSMLLLDQQRPRHAAISSSGWNIIHDTHPEVGITSGMANQVIDFTSFESVTSSWLSDILVLDDGRLLLSSFSGDIIITDSQGVVENKISLPITQTLRLAHGTGGNAWIISSDEGRALEFSTTTMEVTNEIVHPDLSMIYFIGNDMLLVDKRGLNKTKLN